MGDKFFFVKSDCHFYSIFIKCLPFTGQKDVIELFLVFLIFGLLGLVLIFMNKLLGPRKTNPAKEQPFECGSPYLQKGINPFPIKFYLVVVFFFPWALVFKEMRGTALIVMMAYIAVLVVGFVYAWKKGAFEWE
jgi:NADH-quinone oxidoreductase subunit A